MRGDLSGVDQEILRTVHDHPHHGLGSLAFEIGCRDTWHVRSRIIRLCQAGLLKVEIPMMVGRGHKIVIRRAGAR